MKSFAVASVLLAAVAVAQPHGHQHRRHHQQQHEKRALVTEVEWVTETQYVTKLVDSTTTVWITPGQEAEPTSTTDQAKFIETPQPEKKKKKKKETTTSTTSTSTTSTSVYVPPEPTTTSTTSTTTTSTSVYVAPPEETSSIVEYKEPTSEEYVPPTTTSVYVAPTTSEAPAASTSASSGGGSGGGSGGTYSGDITYFTIGLGSCGDDDSGLDNSIAVVALSAGLMSSYAGANSNDNSLCGKTITITANGKSVSAVVKDTCPECALGSIDVSEKVFTELYGGLGKGRGQCEWSFA